MQYRGARTVALLSSLALFASACADAALAPESPGSAGHRAYAEDPSQRPTFRSADEFDAAVDKRIELPTEELVAMEMGQPYPSLRAYLDPNEWTEETAKAGDGSEEATGSEGVAWEKDGVVREDFALSDAVLSLLNHRGEIQIADTIYKLTRDHVYAVLPENLKLLNELVPTLSSPPPADADDRISFRPIDSTDQSREGEGAVKNRVAAPGRASFAISSTATCTWANGTSNGSNRMLGKAYITNTWFYSEAGVKTDWERKKWFVWSNTWTSGTLSASYSTNNLKKGSTWISPASGGASKTGAESVRLVITKGGFVNIRGTISSWHGSPIGWCSNVVSN